MRLRNEEGSAACVQKNAKLENALVKSFQILVINVFGAGFGMLGNRFLLTMSVRQINDEKIGVRFESRSFRSAWISQQ